MGKLNRVLLPALLVVAAYYALFGGEYTVFEARETRARIEAEAAALDELREDIDSLRALADSLESDSAALERVARERFGMIRDGEVLYRFAEPSGRDSAGGAGDRPGEGRR